MSEINKVRNSLIGLEARWFCDGYWHRVNHNDPRVVALADRHYSRQQPGTPQFTPSGKKVVFLTDDALAVWAACENLDGGGATQWRVTMFRNEGPVLSSVLVREATYRTRDYWRRKWGALPSVPLRTEVDRSKTRPKRDPGRCFLKAGWRRVGSTKRGLVLLEAP